MSKSAKLFRERLKEVIDSKSVNVTDLHRQTRIHRTSIYGYLENAVPDLESLDKIADALGEKPWRLIQPEQDRAMELSIVHFTLLNRIDKFNKETRLKFVEALDALVDDFEKHPLDSNSFSYISPGLFRELIECSLITNIGDIILNEEKVPLWGQLLLLVQSLPIEDVKALIEGAKSLSEKKADKETKKTST